jgi:hypothetical protein
MAPQAAGIARNGLGNGRGVRAKVKRLKKPINVYLIYYYSDPDSSASARRYRVAWGMADDSRKQIIRQYNWKGVFIGYKEDEKYIPADDQNYDYINLTKGLAAGRYFRAGTGHK